MGKHMICWQILISIMKMDEPGLKDKERQGQHGASALDTVFEKFSEEVIFKNQNEGKGRTLLAQGTAEVGICLELLGNS